MTLFPEWLAEQQKKIGQVLPPRMREMLRNYGETPGQTCKDCAFLLRARYAKTYLKCEKSRMTHGPGTDWRVRWPACGLWKNKGYPDLLIDSSVH